MYIAYIYDLDNNVIAQIVEVLDLETTKKINDVSTASFSLFHTNAYCTREYIKEYRRVKINILVSWNTEQTIFDGVIRWFESDLTKVSIKCESFEHYLDRRIMNQDYTMTNTVHNILSLILTDLNTNYATNITLDCDIVAVTSKEYKRWESYLKVLQDMAENGYEFLIIDKVLYFKTSIGIDRTTGDDFVEYRYDINEPDDRSINGVQMSTDGYDLANGVVGKAWVNYTYLSDTASKAEFWLIETSFSNSWDDATASQNFLDEHKESLSEFNINAVTQDFFEADLWDTVSVYIYVGNDIMFFDGSMKIVEKEYRAWDLPKISFKLSVSTVKSKNILEQLIEVQSRLKTLEMQ